MSNLDRIRVLADRVKSTVSPEQALTMYVPGFSVNSSGYAHCFTHTEKTASLKILPDHVYCYGCHFGGDTIAIVQRLFKVNPLGAIEKLNADFALGLPVDRPLTLREAMELNEQGRSYGTSVAQRARERRDELSRFERKLDLEQELYHMEDWIRIFAPADDSEEEPYPLWMYAIKRAEYIRFLLKYERY